MCDIPCVKFSWFVSHIVSVSAAEVIWCHWCSADY